VSDAARQALEVLAQADQLYSAARVDAILDDMAARITALVGDAEPLVISVLTGGLVPTGRLLPRLDFPLQLDYLHATRYRGATRGGELHWIARPSYSLTDRTVLIIDDILDEGFTLSAILDYCRDQRALAVYSAVLVEKRLAERPAPVTADVVGCEVEDRYVFGCGMDYHGYHRNLPAIYAVRENE
jgi:hypoxanthine phosphoribosyltransferase